ncbi:MAG: TonB-dependent receptor [Myxococcota bacterium]
MHSRNRASSSPVNTSSPLGITLAAALASLIAILAPGDVLAQNFEGEDPWAGVEQMIVTGAGGVAELLEAPSSVVAFDAEDLATIGAQNVGDIADFTPNLEITSPFAASNPQLFIRGVGLQDSNSNAASAVAVFVDGVYMASPAGQLSQLFDVQGLEVLRGPQGALHGRNASAGAINIRSAPPVHENAAGLNFTYGRFEQLDIDGFLNVPVVQDVIATRFSFKYARRDFLGKNRCNEFYDIDDLLRGNPQARSGTKCNYALQEVPRLQFNDSVPRPPEGVNNRENWAARNLWLIEPMENLSIVLNVHGTQNFGRAPSFQLRGTSPVLNGSNQVPGIFTDENNYLDPDTCTEFNRGGQCVRAGLNPGDGDPYDGDYSRVGDERLTAAGANINLTWTKGPWRLESVIGYESNDREAIIDIDASPFVSAESFFEDTAQEYFFDTRLIWNEESGLELLIGATALYDRLGATNKIFVAANNFLTQDITQKTYHAAIFGHVEWEITEDVIFQGGIRLNYERKGFELSSAIRRLRFNVETPAQEPNSFTRALTEEWHPSGELVLRYEPTSDVKFYWRFSRGYKGRHFNGTAIFPGQKPDAVKAEFVNALELGWSANLFDGVVAWNGAGFFYDYENQQVFQIQDNAGTAFPVSTLINARDSRLIGGETDVTIRWEGFEIAQSIGVTFSEFTDFRDVQETERVSVSGGNVSSTFTVDDFSGNQLVNAPEFSYVSYAQYAWEVPNIGLVTPRFDWRYKSQVFYTAENDDRLGAKARWILDARLTIASLDGQLSLSGWVRNITDEIYPLTAFDRKEGNGAVVWVMSDPRTYGVSASIRF